MAKEKKAEAPDRTKLAAELRIDFNKKYKGKAEIYTGADLDLTYLTKRLPTGMLNLDVALGGGFPASGISQVIGAGNSGKTYLVWQVIRQLQAILGEKMSVLWAMTEMRADRSQGRKAGVVVAFSEETIHSFEKARVYAGLPKFTKEEHADLRRQIGTIDELYGMDAERLYDGILAAVDKNAYHLVIIDSIGNIMSGAEAENESLADKTYGGAAGVNTQFCHKITSMFLMKNELGHTRDTCVIGINQIRDDIGNPNADYKSPGGKALRHALFVDLYLSPGPKIGGYEQQFGPQGAKRVWCFNAKEVNWEIKKGKAGIREGIKGSYVYSFETNAADFYTDTMVAGARAGVIEQLGTYLELKNVDTGARLLYTQGREKFIAALYEDSKKWTEDPEQSLMHYIRTQTLRKNGIFIDYDWS